MDYKIKNVEVVRYPVLRVTFDDGLAGEYDLTDLIADGPIFEPLKDREFFRTVAVGEYGHTFGWNLNDIGNEIDFCPDATRILIETQKVEELAERYRLSRSAAEWRPSPLLKRGESPMASYDLVVIGSGPGGYVAPSGPESSRDAVHREGCDARRHVPQCRLHPVEGAPPHLRAVREGGRTISPPSASRSAPRS